MKGSESWAGRDKGRIARKVVESRNVCPRQEVPHILPAGVGPDPGLQPASALQVLAGTQLHLAQWVCEWELQIGTWFLATFVSDPVPLPDPVNHELSGSCLGV